MRVTLESGEELVIYFSHKLAPKPEKFFHVCNVPYHTKAVTVCSILDDYNQTVEVGKAFCGPGDNFSKAQGRKLALARALMKYTSDKGVRTQVWNAYKERHRV